MADLAVRKSASRLTADERLRFVTAILELKRQGRYDRMVQEHVDAMSKVRPDPAHGGPAFLPWHRYCLRHLEHHLQMVDPSVTLPYWDWTVDRSPTGPPWTEDFMGGVGRERDGQVMKGPFAYVNGDWPITVKTFGREPDFLTRFYRSPDLLPKPREVRRVLQRVPYDARPWNFRTDPQQSFRSDLEGYPHSTPHMVIGGNMTGGGSPNDPVFFLHHANVDRLWAWWQKLHPDEWYRPRTGGPEGHNRDDRMWPWRGKEPPVTPRSVLDHHAMGYAYDDEADWAPDPQ